MREAREESGLDAIRAISEEIFDVDIRTIPARGTEPEHLHSDVRFMLEANRDAQLAVSEESLSLAWVPLDRIAQFNPEASIARLVVKTCCS